MCYIFYCMYVPAILIFIISLQTIRHCMQAATVLGAFIKTTKVGFYGIICNKK